MSVTDRCNMRCRYCMPEDEYVWLPRSSLLTFEEIARLAGVCAVLGVTAVRLTGGEPLLRRHIDRLIALLARGRFADLALTTNGVLLAEQVPRLWAAGLRRITVSLDTLRPDRFRDMTRSDRHAQVLAGIAAARAAGLRVKLNCVVVRGVNDDELVDLIEFARGHDIEARFIEYMDVGGATRWTAEAVIGERELLQRLTQRYGPIERISDRERPSAPALRYRLPDGTAFGIIASTTMPFCNACDRARLTADGHLFLCLYAATGLDLRAPLRAGASDAEMQRLIATCWRERADRGAERRFGIAGRGPLYPVDQLRADPHREMHTRGG